MLGLSSRLLPKWKAVLLKIGPYFTSCFFLTLPYLYSQLCSELYDVLLPIKNSLLSVFTYNPKFCIFICIFISFSTPFLPNCISFFIPTFSLFACLAIFLPMAASLGYPCPIDRSSRSHPSLRKPQYHIRIAFPFDIYSAFYIASWSTYMYLATPL